MIEYSLVTKEEDFANLEKNIYYNFVEKFPDRWIIDNYIKTGEKRLKPYFDYKDLLCFISREDNKIISGSIFYIGKEKTQMEKIGFIIPEWIKAKKYCEGLLMFQNQTKYHPGYIMEPFFNFCINELKNNNYEVILTECYEIMYKIYTRFANFELLEKYDEDGEQKEYILYKKL